MRILFADDDSGIRALARVAIEKIGGFTVEICSSGAEAISKVPSFRPDAVVLDVTMPGMDGPETLKWLRAAPETSAIPVVFLTANSSPDEVRRYKQLGAVGVIAKPFDPTALAGILRDLLKPDIVTPAPNRHRDALGALGKQYFDRLPEKIALLEKALSELQGHWEAAALADAHRLAHNLAGSGSSFGFPAVSSAAFRIDALLKAALEHTSPFSEKEWDDCRLLLEALKKSVDEAGKDSPHKKRPSACLGVPAAPPADTRLIYLVEKDPAIAGDVARQIGYFGYSVRILSEAEELKSAMDEGLPAAVITDVASSSDRHAGIKAIAEIRRGATFPLPVIFISDADDIEMRLMAVRAGGGAYFTRPVDAAKLVDMLDSLTRRSDFEPYRVLIVDDDPLLAERHAIILRQAGMNTSVVTNPLEIMDHLSEFRAELILIDVYMPVCNGMELAKLIRQKESFISIPIVFLSSETDIDKQLAAMNLGGDDFLTKPILPGHLVSAVTARLERSRTLRSLMIRDSLTGLLNHSKTKEHLEIELVRAMRHRRDLVFSIIDIDRFKSVNDTYGHFTGDQVIKGLSRLLQQRLRKTDIVGRYGGEEFAVILQDIGVHEASCLLDQIRADFSMIRHQCKDKEFFVTFSCGISSFPPYRSCNDLIEEADRALYTAKRAGRNRVVTSKGIQ